MSLNSGHEEPVSVEDRSFFIYALRRFESNLGLIGDGAEDRDALDATVEERIPVRDMLNQLRLHVFVRTPERQKRLRSLEANNRTSNVPTRIAILLTLHKIWKEPCPSCPPSRFRTHTVLLTKIHLQVLEATHSLPMSIFSPLLMIPKDLLHLFK